MNRSTLAPSVPDNEGAPSAGLPLRFILLGIASLLASVGCLLVRPDLLATYHYNQCIIAVTHLFVLGFLLSVITGAMYQMAPVVLEVTLHSERLGAWHFGLHLTAVAGLVWSFWHWQMSLAIGSGALLAAGVGLFVYNLARTLRKRPGWDLASASFGAVLGWLTLTVLAGLYLAISKIWAFSPFHPIAAMHAHAHLGVLGAFMVLLVGVSYRLLPMFLLVELPNPRRAAFSLIALNGATLVLFVTLLLDSPWKIGGALLALAGLSAYGLELAALLRTPGRRTLDGGLRQFFAAAGFLVPTALLGLALTWPGLPITLLTTQLETVYGFLALAGVITLAIVGMLYKILPFLVWLRTYGPHVGSRRLPALSDLYSESLQAVGLWSYLAAMGIIAVAAAIPHEPGVRIGTGLWAFSLALFALNVGRILSHAAYPRIPDPNLNGNQS
jgi:hypothetical protein